MKGGWSHWLCVLGLERVRVTPCRSIESLWRDRTPMQQERVAPAQRADEQDNPRMERLADWCQWGHVSTVSPTSPASQPAGSVWCPRAEWSSSGGCERDSLRNQVHPIYCCFLEFHLFSSAHLFIMAWGTSDMLGRSEPESVFIAKLDGTWPRVCLVEVSRRLTWNKKYSCNSPNRVSDSSVFIFFLCSVCETFNLQIAWMKSGLDRWRTWDSWTSQRERSSSNVFLCRRNSDKQTNKHTLEDRNCFYGQKMFTCWECDHLVLYHPAGMLYFLQTTWNSCPMFSGSRQTILRPCK